ncbi:MAG: J domain-containing protein [Rhodospirillales bacterium]|nr:MAG: J domain-containing protein [Rhodospirillales bacterium]
MEQKRDYYEILGIARDADVKAIKDAFRRLALKYHPDRNKDPGAEERFKEIAEAYGILSDPRRRANYDARGHVGVSGVAPEDLFGGIDLDEVLGGLGFDFGHELFARLFGRRRPDRQRGADIEVTLEVPLERIVSGGDEIVRFERIRPCESCDGTGARAGTAPRRCESCGGTGEVTRESQRGSMNIRQISTCPDCDGHGRVIDTPCPQCAGRGQTPRSEQLKLTVPKGLEDGAALRIPGHATAPAASGGRPGDLFVRVHTAPDRRFARKGAGLWRTETIEIPDAVLGTHLLVPTLSGTADTVVPPGTQPDTVLRLRGEGLPRFGSDVRGDLLVRVRIHVPEHVTGRARALYEELRAASQVQEAGRSRKAKRTQKA